MTMKAITDFGIVEVKTIGKAIEICGELWIVGNRPVKYMNAKEPLMLRSVLHCKTGTNLPIKSMPHNAPAKDFLKEAELFLLKLNPDILQRELSKFPLIN